MTKQRKSNANISFSPRFLLFALSVNYETRSMSNRKKRKIVITYFIEGGLHEKNHQSRSSHHRK
jgi:serine protease inhibitor